MQTFSYAAYGLGIVSAFPLLGLPPGNGDADVEIRVADLRSTERSIRESPEGFLWSPTEIALLWDEIGVFLAREGREVLVHPAETADPGEIQIALLGPVLAAILRQRGYMLLHASGVSIEGGVVLFMGSSGWGKSTMAAALHSRGYPLVVDDLAAIRFGPDGASVARAFPHFKLWPDSLKALGEDPGSLPTIGIDYVKRRRVVSDSFVVSESLPLRRIYLLAGGDAPEIEALPPDQAFLQVTMHSYGIRWFLKEASFSQFADRSRLAAEIPVLQLKRPPDLDTLPELVSLVERDVRTPS